MQTLQSMEDLEALYGKAAPASVRKVATRLTPDYEAYIQAARFMTLATVGPEGTDCSPRGDLGPVARVHDDKTLLIPDRHGNNRIDSLRNIIRDPRASLMFMIPGSPTIIRTNGKAALSADPELLNRLEEQGKPPRSVIVFTLDELYFQCARALIRSDLWAGIDDPKLPTPGKILAGLTDNEVGGEAYDKAWPARAKETMW